MFIIDDEDIILQGLISLIDWNSLGFATPVPFTDPLQAMQAAYSDPPDLIITDVEMPGIDGLSLAEDLQKHCPDTMVAILSAYDRFDYVRRALHSGTIHYLLKPVNPGELIELLQTVKNRLTLKKEDAQKRLDQERALEEERRTVTALALQDMLCNDLTTKKTRESQIYRDLIRERVFWVVFIYIPYELTKEREYLPPLQDKVREIMNEIGQKIVSKAFFHINFMPAIVLDAPPDLINISHIIDKLGISSDQKLLWQVYPICIDVNTAKQGFNEALSAFQRWIFLGDNRKTIDLDLNKLFDQSQTEMKRILPEGSPEDIKEAMGGILRKLTAANVERPAVSDFFIAILEYAASLETLHIGDERYQSHSIKIPTMFRISEYALYAEQILLDIQESIQNSLQNF
ncbi:MAG: response regulator, partial [Clostridiaceae bacterium]|nr:response regulator [Clostridiaceae bacterium]